MTFNLFLKIISILFILRVCFKSYEWILNFIKYSHEENQMTALSIFDEGA